MTTAFYSSHPIAKYRIGRFQFERGVLTLEGADVEEFDALMTTQPQTVKRRIKKANQAAAESIARSFLQSRMVAGVDTTANSVEAPGSVIPPPPAPFGGLKFGKPGVEQPSQAGDSGADGGE